MMMRTWLRRLVSRAAVLLGAAGLILLAFAAPASAWSVIVKGAAVCDPTTGTWDVTWTFENDQTTAATLSNVQFTPTTAGSAAPETVPAKQGGTNGRVQVLLSVPTGSPTASV